MMQLFAKAIVQGTSSTAPGLARLSDRLLLSWIGTDPDHLINLAGADPNTDVPIVPPSSACQACLGGSALGKETKERLIRQQQEQASTHQSI